MGQDTNFAAALDMVRETAREIRRLEAGASDALHNRGDKAAHRANLVEKCELLAGLPEQVLPLLKGETPDTQKLREGLQDFARRAGMALDVESVFFMGALLYPDDYQDGEPNDLERFVMRFEASERR